MKWQERLKQHPVTKRTYAELSCMSHQIYASHHSFWMNIVLPKEPVEKEYPELWNSYKKIGTIKTEEEKDILKEVTQHRLRYLLTDAFADFISTEDLFDKVNAKAIQVVFDRNIDRGSIKTRNQAEKFLYKQLSDIESKPLKNAYLLLHVLKCAMLDLAIVAHAVSAYYGHPRLDPGDAIIIGLVLSFRMNAQQNRFYQYYEELHSA